MNLAGLVLTAAITFFPSTQHISTISEAIRLTPRSNVIEETNFTLTITGVVTVPSARTDSTLEVFVQDRTAGIRLFQYDYHGPSLLVGDSIIATGRIGIYYGQEEISTPTIRILRRGIKVPPIDATINQIRHGTFHGQLVRCKGDVARILPAGDGERIYFVGGKDDTASAFIDFRQDPQFGSEQIQIGTRYSFIGISTRFSLKRPYMSGDDILLRSSSDLRPAGEGFLQRYPEQIGIILSLIILIIGSLLVFTYALRTKVRHKTAQLEEQNRILKLFLECVAELTGLLDRKEILALALKRANALTGTQAAVFAEASGFGGGTLVSALKLSGQHILTETHRFETGVFSAVFDQIAGDGAIWNTTIDNLVPDSEALTDFLSSSLGSRNISVIAANPSSRDFLIAFDHTGSISEILPRALIVSYVHHVYSAYKSAELFDVVKEQGSALEKLYNNSVFGLITLSECGTIQTANKIAVQMFEDDNLIGGSVREYLASNDASRLDDLLRSVAAVSKERFVRFSAEIRAKQGIRTFEFALQFDPSSRVFYATVQDTSDREYYENYETSEKNIDNLSRLAASLTHDLNNIVGSISGYASLLKRKLHPESREHHYADIIENSSKRTTELVKEVLGFAQLDAKSVEVVDLNEFCTEIAGDFKKIHGDKYSILMTPLGQPVRTRISTSQLRQVIMAVLTNAAEAMDLGGTVKCTVGLRNVPDSAPAYVSSGVHCLIEIEDHGLGMDETIRRRIFEPFFTTKRVRKYTGLSLSMALNIIKQHKGFIDVESSPGSGTKVRIFLPLIVEEVGESPAQRQPQAGEPNGMKILVVDDDESVRQLGHDILSDHGYSVLTAGDGAQALNSLNMNPDIRLVLLDMVMPVMGGKDACLEIKKKQNPPKVLICTGYSELSDLESILGKYADGLIQKPYSTSELTSSVDRILNISKE